ncbi:MAG: MarR family transcriptional regulator [Myxococcales bacterium FL481]|nr:MAG: MarR family transcriptional regulator [Myxococcales bacterium FL481]
MLTGSFLFGDLPPPALEAAASMVPNVDLSAVAAVYQLAKGSQALLRVLAEQMSQGGLTPPRYRILTLLAFQFPEGATVQTLAQALGIRPPTMTTHLNGLETGGLLRRNPDPANRRSTVVRLTPKGQRLLKQVIPVVASTTGSLLESFSQREVNLLVRLMSRLEQHCERLGQDHE